MFAKSCEDPLKSWKAHEAQFPIVGYIEGRFASIEELKDRTTSPPLNMNNWDTLRLLLKWRNVGGKRCVPEIDFALLQNGWWCLKKVTNCLILYFKHPLNF